MRIRWLLAALMLIHGAGMAVAQGFSGLARLDVAESGVRDLRRGMEVELYLSQPVPWRVFVLDEPRRLVLDFREVDWRGASAEALLQGEAASDLRFGALRPGWSRMVVDLAEPMLVEEAGMRVTESDGTAHLLIRLRDAEAAEFTAAAGAPDDPDWALLASDPTAAPAMSQDQGGLIVVIDPGHGGIDPGAQHGGEREADLMLALGYELASALERVPGITPYLTRDSDIFVPLEERMTLARNLGADLFISLHMDALEGLQATGASVYTLSDDAGEEASQRMAERHERGDLLAGVDLSGQDDQVATILMDLARLETGPAGDRFADALVQVMRETGVPLNSRPRRHAVLAVLTSADFPAVLLEVGFLSNEADRARLATPQGRAGVVEAVMRAISRWSLEEQALRPLMRQ